MKKARSCSINLCRNDSVDVRCGGPSVLGFDFHLDSKLSEKEWLRLIREEIAKKRFPLEGISITRPRLWAGKVWTPLAVRRCIRKYSIN